MHRARDRPADRRLAALLHLVINNSYSMVVDYYHNYAGGAPKPAGRPPPPGGKPAPPGAAPGTDSANTSPSASGDKPVSCQHKCRETIFNGLSMSRSRLRLKPNHPRQAV